MDYPAAVVGPRAHPVQDAALAVAVTGTGLAEVWVPFSSAAGEGSLAASSAMVVLLGLAVAVRRTNPVVVLAVSVAFCALAYAFAPVHVLFWGGMVPLMVLVYTVARHREPRQAWIAVAVTAAMLLVLELAITDLREPDDFVFRWANAVVAFALGRVLQRAEIAGRESALRARAAEESMERAAIAARNEERARIAREMHDVVAHTVSVMVVQAGAAEGAVEDDPDFAREAFARIRATGAEALNDMHRVLAVLRDHEEVDVLVPHPRLSELPDLVRGLEMAGIRADLVVEGAPRPLPAGLDLTAYRIAQEALTNVRRHSGADRATVRLLYRETQLELEVVDDGQGAVTGRSPTGHGILGMHERVALYGGRLDTQTGDVGFRVHAVLPLEPS